MIYVNEIFGPTIQGEGKSIGKRTSFLRLAFCNLKCIWCDTPYSWDFRKFSRKLEVRKMTSQEIYTDLRDRLIKSVVISGGEPLLQQKKLVSLLQLLKENDFWIEIETNGTIIPSKEVVELVDQFNCSPKLLNSGNKNGLKGEVLSFLNLTRKSNFKFVIDEIRDFIEICEVVLDYKLQEIYIMPQGRTREELIKKERMVKAISEKYGFIFTQRLHILKFGSRRGV